MCHNFVFAVGLRQLAKNILTVSPQRMGKDVVRSTGCQLNLTKLLSGKADIRPSTVSETVKVNQKSKDFITIYRLPAVSKIALIGSMRRLQAYLVSMAAPTSIALALADVISTDISMTVCGVGIVLAIKLHFLNQMATNVVGVILVSPDMSTVQISYLDHYGKRKEAFLSSANVVPLSESPRHFMEPYYYALTTYSQPKSVMFKLNLSHGNVIDVNRFNNIFGKLD